MQSVGHSWHPHLFISDMQRFATSADSHKRLGSSAGFCLLAIHSNHATHPWSVIIFQHFWMILSALPEDSRLAPLHKALYAAMLSIQNIRRLPGSRKPPFFKMINCNITAINSTKKIGLCFFHLATFSFFSRPCQKKRFPPAIHRPPIPRVPFSSLHLCKCTRNRYCPFFS